MKQLYPFFILTYLMGCFWLPHANAGLSAQQKLDHFGISKVDFREVTLGEALASLIKMSEKSDPEGLGINLINKLDKSTLNKRVTVHLRDQTLGVILEFLAEIGEFQIRADKNAVILSPAAR